MDIIRQLAEKRMVSHAYASEHASRVARRTAPPTRSNQALQQLLNARLIQAKLAVSQPGDVYEQEADRVADTVMRMLAPPAAPTSNSALTMIQLRDSLPNPRIQRGAAETVPPIVHEVLRSPGQPLDASARAFMEPRFGHDFSQVRVHVDTRAMKSAREVNANAYTVGHNIVFGAGRFEPGTQEGQGLLAHELAHTLQQTGGAPARVARQPMDPRHARGFGGEQGMGFIHYRQEDGWIFFEGPSGSAGHGVTESGFDGVAYNVRTGEIHLVDNKSLARQGNVGSATAIDPSRNLGKNLDGLIQRVEAAKDVPGRVRLLGRLRALKASLAAGKPLPQDVKVVVTGVGGRSTGVTGRLQSEGVEFRPEPAPKSQPVATTTAPKPPTPVEEPPIAAPTVKPPAAPSPAAAPAPVVEGKPSPVVAPPVRPTSRWKAGLKAGGKALLVALAFAGLEYLVQRKLEKDLDESIDKARHGAMPWAQRLKRNDPSKPVYMRVMVESRDYSRYVPFFGWMPETPVLHMIQIAMVREEIDPPVVEVRDERFRLWHPGVTTTVTYTEPMVP